MGLHGSGQGSVSAVLAEELILPSGVLAAVLTHVLYPQRLLPALPAATVWVSEELPGESFRGGGHNTYMM